MRIIYKFFIVPLFVFWQTQMVYSQGGPPRPSMPGALPPPPPRLPIDQGLLYLLFVGVCLGLFVIKKSYLKKVST